MANFNSDAPKWDKAFKNSSYNKRRLRNAHGSRKRDLIYFSDYRKTGGWLKNDRQLRKVLSSEARRIRRVLRSVVPTGTPEDGHVRDAIKVKMVKHGGIYRDRMAYHVYVDAQGKGSPGDQFLHAEFQSQFTREAWERRMLGKSTNANRAGWVETALTLTSLRKGRKRRAKNSAAAREDQWKKQSRRKNEGHHAARRDQRMRRRRR